MADNINSRLYARTYTPAMRTNSPPPKQPAVCAPPCADCGLLECLCRPRFFAGQLLTDQDLNRLDAYIRAKNRMHNLQLHGWGVVNGLQVRCDACSTGVIVGTGYAIDPCGEDIVVCKDTPVDICSLIKRCQQQDITCVPSSRDNGQSNCDDVEEDWVLAIRYTETQARAITALRSTPSCACGAKGGCSCGTSCGCGTKTTSTAPTNAMTAATVQKPRTTPAECEATAICEGYSWDVFLAPTDVPRKDGQNQLSGGIIDAINCCIEPFMASLPQPPSALTNVNQNQPAWYLWCCRMKAALIAFFTNGPQANCTAITTLQGIECPQPDDEGFDQKLANAYYQYIELELEALFACFCAALLPPAPCGTSDDRVPLAIVTVRKKDCKVLRVCNWTHLRKLVITWPTLEYWFGWIPWFKTLQDQIAKFCCAEFTIPQRETTGVYTNVHGSETAYLNVNPQVDPQLAKDNATMSSLIMSALTRGNAAVDPAAILGLPTKQPLADVEKSNLAPFLLLNQLARPMVASAVPSDLQARVSVLEKMVADMAKKQGDQ